MTQVKLLALDLDGTLTNSDKVVTPRTRAALQQAAQRGVCRKPHRKAGGRFFYQLV